MEEAPSQTPATADDREIHLFRVLRRERVNAAQSRDRGGHGGRFGGSFEKAPTCLLVCHGIGSRIDLRIDAL